jgi:hypothetical protein
MEIRTLTFYDHGTWTLFILIMEKSMDFFTYKCMTMESRRLSNRDKFRHGNLYFVYLCRVFAGGGHGNRRTKIVDVMNELYLTGRANVCMCVCLYARVYALFYWFIVKLFHTKLQV